MAGEGTWLLPRSKDRGRILNAHHEKFRDEAALLVKSSSPVILAYMLQNSLQTVSIIIAGKGSSANLATAAFAYMFAMATAWLIALGGTTAMDTLGSSCYTASSNSSDLGILLQRSFLVLGGFYVPVIIIWVFAEPLFLTLGLDAKLAYDGAVFLWYLIPGGLGYIAFECMKKFLQVQEIMHAGSCALTITAPVNAALNFLFIHTFKLGIVGAPLATGTSYWLAFGLLVLYARYVKGGESWNGWSVACLDHLGVFARLALAGIIHVGAEWWAFEIVALVAGRLGPIPLAAQSVIMTTDQIINTIPLGLGVAISPRVGNLLGRRDAKGCARASNAAMTISVLCGAIILLLLMVSREKFALIFDKDYRVVDLTARILPLVAAFQIADGLTQSSGGILRGMGRQHVGAGINFLAYYAGALPMGIWLAFHGHGLWGLWLGQCVALYIAALVSCFFVQRTNWDFEIAKAFERMR